MDEAVIFETAARLDAGAIVAFWRDNDVTLSATDTAEAVAEARLVNPELFIVALEAGSGAIAGTVWGNFDGRRGFVVHLGVRRDLRKRGLARALMDRAEARFRELGVFRVHLFVEKTNFEVVDYYARRGYEARDDLALLSKTF